MSIRVALVGATGIAGQQWLVALAGHPWFHVTHLAASARSAGQTYAEALRDPKTGARQWWCAEEPPAEALELPVEHAADLKLDDVDVVFSAVESAAARELEAAYAERRPVVSTASAFRYEPDVPILIAGVNDSHLRAIDAQRRRRGWSGFVVPIPNCTVTGLAVTLKPLHDAFGLERVVMTSLQGLSGAGRSPGVLALDVVENVIPFIPGEEEKVEREARKLLGEWDGESFRELPVAVSATCTRVPVLEAHTETVYVGTRQPVDVTAAAKALREFGAELRARGLPSAPERLILVHDDPFRPQPRLDRQAEQGMATTVGRLREDPVLAPGIKYVLVTHNTRLGAARGATLVAELLVQEGYIGDG